MSQEIWLLGNSVAAVVAGAGVVVGGRSGCGGGGQSGRGGGGQSGSGGGGRSGCSSGVVVVVVVGGWCEYL